MIECLMMDGLISSGTQMVSLVHCESRRGSGGRGISIKGGTVLINLDNLTSESELRQLRRKIDAKKVVWLKTAKPWLNVKVSKVAFEFGDEVDEC
jgi:hypothetical protein